MRVTLSQEAHVVWGKPRSHPASMLRPIRAGFLGSVSGNKVEELAFKPSVLKARSHFLLP